MATQARERVKISENAVRVTDHVFNEAATLFQYRPLDPNVDTIRVIILEQGRFLHDTIYCRIEHAPFGQKPKYEALSYTWGTHDDKRAIYVNGKLFEITPNLYDALTYLRSKNEERTLWVDAICINQADILERNRQVRFMAYIYSRAQQVLVWLGTPGLNHIHIKTCDVPASSEDIAEDDKWSRALPLLHSHEYWNRVWIVQELSKARRLKIHFGRSVIVWREMIRWIKSRPEYKSSSRPLQLDRLLEDKYGDSNKLENLLQTHQTTLCSEPRDKIFGFLGLAMDYNGQFPIDYKTSLFDLYEDVLLFTNRQRTGPYYSAAKHATLVCQMLGEDAVKEGASGHHERLLTRANRRPEGLTAEEESLLLRITTTVHGKISHMGPSYNDLMSKVQAHEKWIKDIDRKSPANDHKNLRKENDLFIELLETVDEEHLQLDIMDQFSWTADRDSVPHFINSLRLDLTRHGNGGEISASPHVFLISRRQPGLKRSSRSGADCSSHPGSIGICTSAACEGDYICEVHGSNKVVIVRQMPEMQFVIVGLAMIVDDVRGMTDTQEQLDFSIADLSQDSDFEFLDVFIDSSSLLMFG